MSLRRVISDAANAALEPLNLRISRVRPTTWDRQFVKWVREARTLGIDPNDVGDAEWGDGDLLPKALEEVYLPLIEPSSLVLELGPGSGRLTRHLIGKCAKLIAVDFSSVVCRWLQTYLQGKGAFEIRLISKGGLADITSGSVDVALAHGVFEHFETSELFSFLTEFERILRPEGVAAFNFNSFLTEDGLRILREQRDSDDSARFRFHHPDSILELGHVAGFPDAEIIQTDTRIAFAILRKA